MCTAPKIPPPPPPPQEVKQPDSVSMTSSARRNRGGMAAPSLLTGPQGVTGAVSTARNTLLGG